MNKIITWELLAMIWVLNTSLIAIAAYYKGKSVAYKRVMDMIKEEKLKKETQ